MANFFQHPTGLSSYAVIDSKQKRFFAEEKCCYRSAFVCDRDRIVHSMAFRRLGYKTQAFANYAGDHYRTRLTHSLEVAQISRLISEALGVNADLAEAIALAHDLGHPPFGHAGEHALNKAALVAGGVHGFDHNAHTLRIVTLLEQVYPQFDGLNLSWETIEGLIKHNGPIKGAHSKHANVPQYMLDIAAQYKLQPEYFPSLEAQVAGLADDIAYCNHDLDDGVRAGFLAFAEMQHLDTIWQIIKEVDQQYPNLNETRRKNEIIRRLTHLMMQDVIQQTQHNIKHNNIKTIEDIWAHSAYLVQFSPDMESFKNNLKAFLFKKVYHHYQINRMTQRAQRIITKLFGYFEEAPQCLPSPWQERFYAEEANEAKLQVITDYIAGMTDRYAMEEYKRLID